ncbi:MAG: TlpA disulfide reductase family protein [Polyangiaceae bacterium]
MSEQQPVSEATEAAASDQRTEHGSPGQESTAPESGAPESTPPAARTRRRRWLSWLLQGMVVVLIYLGASTWRSHSLLPSDGSVEAPAVQLRTLDGKSFDLRQLRGKRVQLHFWATWCTVCRQEFGALNSVHDDLGDDEAMVSIVADSEDPRALARFVQEHDIRYPVLLGSPDVLRAYQIQAFPTNYYLDAKGRIRGTDVGMSTRWGMSKRIGCAR